MPYPRHTVLGWRCHYNKCHFFKKLPCSFHFLSKSEFTNFTHGLSQSLSACFFTFFLRGRNGEQAPAGSGQGPGEAAGPPAQQRLARRSQPAASRGQLGRLRAHPGARLPAGRAPGWSGRRSRRRSQSPWEDAQAGAPHGGKAGHSGVGGTPACSGLFAKPTRGGQWGQVLSPEARRPTSAATYAPVLPAPHPAPTQPQPANVGIAWRREARTLGIFPSPGNLCNPRLTSRPPSTAPIPHSLSSSRQQGRRRSQR